MHADVVHIDRVPVPPGVTQDFVEDIHKVRVPVHSHVSNALRATEVLVEFPVELDHA